MKNPKWRWVRIGVCVAPPEETPGEGAIPVHPHLLLPSSYDLYCRELLQHAGFFYENIPYQQLTRALSELSILITVGHTLPARQEKEALQEFVAGGGVWIAIGSTWDCDELFGVQTEPNPLGGGSPFVSLGEGYVSPQKENPIFPPSTGRLHFFGGIAVQATTGKALAVVQNVHGGSTPYAAIVRQSVKQGATFLFAVHLGKTAAVIQHGRTVAQDGIPPSDGSALIEDGILRIEDGLVLDWLYDRSQEATEFPYFRTPVTDCWREILTRAVLQSAQQGGGVCPLLWYYPRHLNAIGVLSIEVEEGDVENDLNFLHLLTRIGARSTWCIRPPGYPLNFYRELLRRENDIALCFDLDQPGANNISALHMQQEQIRRSASLQSLASVRTKNLGWRGGKEFYEWCEKLGLRAEIGRGGYAPGASGFTFGSCHPWRPLRSNGEPYRTYVLPLLAYEIGTRLPFNLAYELLETTLQHEGVAHFATLPALANRVGWADELRRLVAHGRLKGMEWWTVNELITWEESRRSLRHRLTLQGDSLHLTLTSLTSMENLSLLMLSPTPLQMQVNRIMLTPRPIERYGFRFHAIELDLREKETRELVLTQALQVAA